MPIFEYRCESCQKEFELLIVGAGSGPALCPGCGGAKVQKLFSRFGFNSPGGVKSFGSGGSGCASCTSTNCGSCAG